MPRLQFTPWKDPSELLSVRDQFYPPVVTEGSADMRAKACSLVWVWKLRGNLPHAVEATALLTDAILHDDARKNSIFSIRATYSAAFCRFVTGLVDSKLYGRRQTMFQKAVELGLPASFVELRHEATHRELPSLIVLRNAAHRSLDWLWGFYWAAVGDVSAVGAGDESISEPTGKVQVSKDTIRQRLKDAVLGSNGLTESSSKKKGSRRTASFPGLEDIAQICDQQPQGDRAVAQVLMEQSIVVPASRTLGSSMEPTFSTWDEFLKELCRHHTPFLTTLGGEMARMLVEADTPASQNDPYKEAIYVYLDHILSSDAWAAVRGLYLSICYIDAACCDAAGYWAGRLRSLVDQQSQNLDTDTAMETDGPEIGADGTIMPATDMESEADSLRGYGWNVNGNWRVKPNGAV
ncbi:hypothetical protein FQN50_007708 [Emmonsiellopsis sp. PD_5]|nr:hypothetical protein FQN50_007708 [Emmonsiellopsis sp. PD_5]